MANLSEGILREHLNYSSSSKSSGWLAKYLNLTPNHPKNVSSKGLVKADIAKRSFKSISKNKPVLNPGFLSKPTKSFTNTSSSVITFQSSANDGNVNKTTRKRRRNRLTSVSSEHLITESNIKVINNKKPLNISAKSVENRSEKKLKRFNSDTSDELPIFKKATPRKTLESIETFEKYGVIVPSVDEIIADQKRLSNYKIQVAEANRVDSDVSEELPTFKRTVPEKKSKLIKPFKKHETVVPSIDEIIAEQKRLSKYKTQLKEAKRLVSDTSDELYLQSTIVPSIDEIGADQKNLSNLKKKKFDSDNNDAKKQSLSVKGQAPCKRPKKIKACKTYGVLVPSIDEIIADQKCFSKYKIQVEKAQALEAPIMKMPNIPMKYKDEETYLDCKHLTLEDINEQFKKNLSFLSGILKGHTPSDRHQQYNDKMNRIHKFTNLTFSTSTIVFGFEQLDLIISLLHEEFDPLYKKTCYIFKVLLPELCLKIFMDIHNMNKTDAISYLDKRPV